MFTGGRRRKIENSRFAVRFGRTPSRIGKTTFQSTPNARKTTGWKARLRLARSSGDDANIQNSVALVKPIQDFLLIIR
jgi:hypothetical protein